MATGPSRRSATRTGRNRRLSGSEGRLRQPLRVQHRVQTCARRQPERASRSRHVVGLRACGEYEVRGGGDRAQAVRSGSFVRTVRGRFHGWAAVNVSNYLKTGKIAAGSVQLASPTDRVSGPLTNARLFGLFRGKIADHDDDGYLDVNSVQCHGTVEGEHDLHCDGSQVDDPFAK